MAQQQFFDIAAQMESRINAHRGSRVKVHVETCLSKYYSRIFIIPCHDNEYPTGIIFDPHEILAFATVYELSAYISIHNTSSENPQPCIIFACDVDIED